jgi:hypothetical protein
MSSEIYDFLRENCQISIDRLVRIQNIDVWKENWDSVVTYEEDCHIKWLWRVCANNYYKLRNMKSVVGECLRALSGMDHVRYIVNGNVVHDSRASIAQHELLDSHIGAKMVEQKSINGKEWKDTGLVVERVGNGTRRLSDRVYAKYEPKKEAAEKALNSYLYCSR